MNQSLKIATRKSPLALWQAYHVKELLEQYHPELSVSLVEMSTKGDEILDTSLSRIGGKGLFIKELEQGMLRGEADVAVHSLKDVPYELPEGFALGAVLERENPSDSFVSNEYTSPDELPIGAIVGTCSNRRIIQLQSLRPDLVIKELRGSVNTRLKKLDDKEFDAIILASAGLIRLGFADRMTQQLPLHESLPAVGQGAVAIEIRAGDTQVAELIAPLVHEQTLREVSAERRVNAALAGNCSAPIAIYAKMLGNVINIKAMVGSIATNTIITASISGEHSKWKALADELVQRLTALGARDLLTNE